MRRPNAQSPSGDKNRAGAALIVQNNAMMALEIEALLQDAGVETCFLAATAAAALPVLESRDIAFAIVDTNLGQEMLEAVANALLERKLPFIFTTDYDDDMHLAEQFPGAPVLAKPLREALLYRTLAKIGAM